jgi:hypothetical protein
LGEEDVFQYVPQSEFSGDEPAPKLGCLCSESHSGAAKHLEFFFDELFGVNQLQTTNHPPAAAAAAAAL